MTLISTSMAKSRIECLRPRLGALDTRTAPPVDIRLRGRAAVERRAHWLRAHPLCLHCEQAGRVSVAQEVDHITALEHGGADSENNLQSLCIPCHLAKTRAERKRAAGNII